MSPENRKTSQFVLALPMKNNPSLVLPLLRADTREELEALVERESVDADGDKKDWASGSQLVNFMHPSEVILLGHDPFAKVDLEAQIKEVVAQIEEQWDSHIMVIPIALDRPAAGAFGIQS